MTYLTAMTTETKTIFAGLLSGALITAALSAFVWWIFTYTDPGSGFLGPNSAGAPVAAIVGAVIGLLGGAILGVVLSMMRRGSLFGTLAGAIAGLAIVVMILARDGLTTGDPRVDLMFWAFVPVGATSGFLTSLIVSAVASSAKPSEPTYTVLGLQQNKTDESR